MCAQGGSGKAKTGFNKKNQSTSPSTNSGPLLQTRSCFRSVRTSGKTVSASLTLEASLALSLFIFAVVLIAIPIDMLDTQRRIQMTVEAAARDAACAAVLLRKEEGEADGEGKEEKESLNTALLTSAGAQVYLLAKVKAAGGSRIQDVTVLGSAVRENGDDIDFRASYRIRLPFRVFTLTAVPFSARSRKHGWTGSDRKAGSSSEGNKEEEMVYVGRDGTRYHRSPSCHYISNEIHHIPAASLPGIRNDSGRSYRPCRVCGTHPVSEYYVLPAGETYHTRADCSSLSYYVREVPLSRVEYLGPCSYCGGGH